MRKVSLKKHASLFIVLAFALLVSPRHATPLEWPLVSVETAASEIAFKVEVARTQEKISRGLMFRESLDADRGMLFIFPDERRLSFWMKDTPIPLDIIFADSKGKIVGIATMEPCTEDHCPVFYSPEASMYALEINGGAAETYNIRQGNRIMLHFEPPSDHPLARPGEP